MALHFASALLNDGWRANVRVTIADGFFAEVSADTPPAPDDERHAIAVPGVMNLHSHAFQRAMAGRAETSGAAEDSFWTWREAMYALALTLDPDAFEAAAFAAFKTMLENGFTRVGEFHYLHNAPDGAPYADPAEMAMRLVSAAERAGISLTLLPALYRFGGFGASPLQDRQRRFGMSVEVYAALFESIRALEPRTPGLIAGLCAHSLRAVSPDDLTMLAGLDPARPLHIHIAEQMGEVSASLAHFGARPVAWLLANAEVSSRWCLVHATHTEPSELAGIAGCGAVVGLCPITEANLGDGIFPAVEYAALGGAWGVGTDSNVEITAAGELRLLEYGQRLQRQQRNVLAGGPGRSTATALSLKALNGGAQALGQKVAGIAVGAPADIVALADAQGATGSAALDRFVFAPDTGVRIDRVWARGRLRVRDGVWVG